jgi:hypothetical protein
MAFTISSTQSPLVGKYLSVTSLEFDPYGETWGFICYCESFSNNTYTVRNKFGKVYNATINQIEEIIDITEQQKYHVGDVVEAKIEYLQKDGDWSTEFCQVISVNNFANDFDYVLKDVKNGKTYNLSQNSIIQIVTLIPNKFQLNQYVGVTHVIGPQWDPVTIVKNGIILKVNTWYNRVTYDIKYDTCETENVLENRIVPPGVKKIQKTPEQIKHDELEFLRQEEQRLLQQLQMVRAARTRVE